MCDLAELAELVRAKREQTRENAPLLALTLTRRQGRNVFHIDCVYTASNTFTLCDRSTKQALRVQELTATAICLTVRECGRICLCAHCVSLGSVQASVRIRYALLHANRRVLDSRSQHVDVQTSRHSGAAQLDFHERFQASYHEHGREVIDWISDAGKVISHLCSSTTAAVHTCSNLVHLADALTISTACRLCPCQLYQQVLGHKTL